MRETTDGPASTRLGRRGLLTGGVAAATGAGAAVLAGAGVAEAQTPPPDSVFNVKDYGAVGDLWTNDTAAIQAAINAALVTGGIVWFPAGWFRITGTLRLNGPTFNIYDKPITLQGVGDATVLFATNSTEGTDPNWKFSGTRLLEAHGKDETKVPLASAAPKGSRQLVVPPGVASTLSIGSIVALEEEITSGWVFAPNGKPQEQHKVVSKNGNTVDLDSPTLFGYSAAAQVYKVTPVQGIKISDLAITAVWDPTPVPAPAVERPGIYAIRIGRSVNVRIERVRVFNAAGGIFLTNAVDAHIGDCVVDNLPRLSDAMAPYGYGVALEGPCANVSITGLVGRGCRHVFTTLLGPVNFAGPRDVAVVGGIGEGGDVRPDNEGPRAIWDTHEGAFRISYIGCSATGVGLPGHSGFQVRSNQVRIIDCTAKHNALRGITVAGQADDVTISGGEVAYNGECGIAAGVNTTVTGVEVHHNAQRGVNWNGGERIHVTNCSIHDNVNEGIRDQSVAGSKTKIVVITGNIVPKGSGSFPQPNSCTLIGGTNGAATTNAVIANNVFRGYGTTNDGTWSIDASAVKQNNVVGP